MGNSPKASNTSAKVQSSLSQVKQICDVFPCVRIRSACKCNGLPLTFTSFSSNPLFHFFRLPTMHFQVQVAVCWNIKSYAEGTMGSKQKISILLPVCLKNCKRACITLVLLNTKQAFGGKQAGNSLKTRVSILPLLYTNNLEQSLCGSGYLAIRSSGNG